MSKLATSYKEPTPMAGSSPFISPQELLDVPHPLTGLAIIQLSQKTAAGFEGSAIKLAKLRATEKCEQGEVDAFADWCMVILALEELERSG
jgi:hypothetical protein